MTWYYSLSKGAYLFIAFFLIAYGLYLFRAIKVARALASSWQLVLVKLTLRTLFFALLIIALLGPSFGNSQREVKAVGKDIFFAVDLSESMNAHDISPTRLEKVKFELKNIVRAFNSDRIGIIIFSNDAFVQCPLTYDQGAVTMFIESLSSDLLYSGGTDFAPPLELAVNKILRKDEARSDQKSKVIILISDGEDFGGNADDVVSTIKSRGIQLYTLGVGTEEGSTIMAKRGSKKDKQGNTVVSKLESSSLKKLARQAGGEYYEISKKKNEVQAMIKDISEIEGEVRESRMVDVSANRYQYFLAIALFLLFLDGMISFNVIKL